MCIILNLFSTYIPTYANKKLFQMVASFRCPKSHVLTSLSSKHLLQVQKQGFCSAPRGGKKCFFNWPSKHCWKLHSVLLPLWFEQLKVKFLFFPGLFPWGWEISDTNHTYSRCNTIYLPKIMIYYFLILLNTADTKNGRQLLRSVLLRNPQVCRTSTWCVIKP